MRIRSVHGAKDFWAPAGCCHSAVLKKFTVSFEEAQCIQDYVLRAPGQPEK